MLEGRRGDLLVHAMAEASLVLFLSLALFRLLL
jgi:hypothetical protein